MQDEQNPAVILEGASLYAQAIAALKADESRVSQLAIEASDKWTPMYLGRLAEAISVAEDVLFNVLNAGHNMVHCASSEAALDFSRSLHQRDRARRA